MKNRLDDLTTQGAAPEAVPVATAEAIVLDGDSVDIEMGSMDRKKFFEDLEKVKDAIKFIEAQTKEIVRLQDESLNAVRTEDSKATSEKLEKLLVTCNGRCAQIKKLLSDLKEETEKMSVTAPASEIRIRKTTTETMTQKFVSTVRRYQQAQQEFKAKSKEKVARQVRIVKPDATLEDIDTAMKSGDPGAIYRAAILQPGADPVAQAYMDVQAKYKDVLALEESVTALNQMFQDLGLLVERQGEMVNQIEFQIAETADHVSKGNKELTKALEAKKALRKKYMCLAFIILVVIVVLIVVFLK